MQWLSLHLLSCKGYLGKSHRYRNQGTKGYPGSPTPGWPAHVPDIQAALPRRPCNEKVPHYWMLE